MLTCIQCNKTSKDVAPRTTPDRRDFKMFNRCDECYEQRYQSARRTMNRYPEAFTGPCPFDSDEW